jgi:hypothetical protein
VHDVGGARRPAVAQQVGHVLGQPRRPPPARRRPAVEALVDPVAARPRHVAVRERPGDERDVGACARERRGQRVVVRRRVRRGVDEVDAHEGRPGMH